MTVSMGEYGVWFANIGGWLLIHLGVSWFFAAMPDRWFMGGTRNHGEPAEPGAGEIRFYESALRIRSWKDKLPEAGGLFGIGFSKKSLRSREPAYIDKFVLETRRGERAHLASMLPAPVFFLWNEAPAGLAILLYAAVANLPFVAVQRYNRARLLRARQFILNREKR